ncbi:MAG TPA: formyltransferase family protein, partial [Steroidobacteraceae bacterium]|nr:formyltransferase family protein [Steroidobacteraceae bacterium]
MTAEPRALRPRLAIFISGGGSNMVAIARACAAGEIQADVAVVISDQAKAGGIERARQLDLPVVVVNRDDFRIAGRLDRQAFEAALAAAVQQCKVDLVILAGFMSVLSAAFVAQYMGRMLNIHPSLLPRYAGLDTHARVLAA